jgi:hypothetical protein
MKISLKNFVNEIKVEHMQDTVHIYNCWIVSLMRGFLIFRSDDLRVD